MRGVWDIAHSTPLELASELGVPLALIVAAAWMVALILLVTWIMGAAKLHDGTLSALAVSLIALLHSSIDFSLQIAGYSIVVFALLGLGLARAVSLRCAPTNDLTASLTVAGPLKRRRISVNLLNLACVEACRKYN